MARLGLLKVCAILLIVFTGLTFYQRLSMECSVARTNSAHFERVSNEVQDEVADWRRKYDGESARADECNAKMIRELKQKTDELDEALAQLASAHRDNLKHVDEITELNAELSKLRESTVDDVAMRNQEEVNQM